MLPEDLAVVLGSGTGNSLLLVLLGLAADGAAKAGVEVLDGLLEGWDDALLLVIGGDDDGDLNLGGLNVAGVGDAESGIDGCGGLAQLTLSEPAVVPAGKGTGLADCAVRVGGEVGLLGGERVSRFGRDDMEDEEDLSVWFSLVLTSGVVRLVLVWQVVRRSLQ